MSEEVYARAPEFRYEASGGPLDEVVFHRPKLVHFERMDNGVLWCGVTLEDGRTFHIDIYTESKCKHKLFYRAEER